MSMCMIVDVNSKVQYGDDSTDEMWADMAGVCLVVCLHC